MPVASTRTWDRTPERRVWGVLKVWRADTGQPVRALEHGVKPIVSIAYSPDGSTLAAGTWDYDVALFDTKAWGTPAVLMPPKDSGYSAVRGLAFSHDGRSLVVGAKDGTVRVWDVVSLES